jgi:ABC-2 type transport system permease protein
MMAFSAVNIDALIQVKKHLIRLISGSIIPLWFFPDPVANVIKFLPFPYIYQLPLSIYIGRGTRAEIFTGMEIQLAWAVVLFLVFLFAQKQITRKVMVQGG